MNSDRGQGGAVSQPPVLECEPDRLEELYSLDILDTAFEERFDRYTTLVASLFEFSVCLVTLVDDDRQWFKSACGPDFRETKRDRSLLQYLRRLPFAALKIDRSFVSHVTENAGDATIARAVIALGQTPGVTVIAEGVETDEQLDFLRGAGCAQAQGFLLGRPMPAADALSVVRRG